MRTGPIGWSFAAGLTLFGLASAGGVVEGNAHPGYLVVALAFSAWALLRASLGGVWIDPHGNLVIRDWLRTRRYLADKGLVVSYVPYDGFVSCYQESRVWATLHFASTDQRPRACRMTVARFGTTKDRVRKLRRELGLATGPGRME